MAQVEEFLILTKKKKRITFSIEESQTQIDGIGQNEKQHIILKKDNWGYATIEVKSDAACVEPVKKVITTEDFIGNRAVAEYVILEDKLHAGNNYVRLTFENQFQQESVELCIIKDKKQEEKDNSGGQEPEGSNAEANRI